MRSAIDRLRNWYWSHAVGWRVTVAGVLTGLIVFAWLSVDDRAIAGAPTAFAAALAVSAAVALGCWQVVRWWAGRAVATAVLALSTVIIGLVSVASVDRTCPVEPFIGDCTIAATVEFALATGLMVAVFAVVVFGTLDIVTSTVRLGRRFGGWVLRLARRRRR